MEKWSTAAVGVIALAAIACGLRTGAGGPATATETQVAAPPPRETAEPKAECQSLLTLEEVQQIMPGTNMQPGAATALEGGGSACTFTGNNDTLHAGFQVLLNTSTKAEFDRIASDPASTPVPNVGDAAYLKPMGFDVIKGVTVFSLVVIADAQDPQHPAADLEQIREKWEAELLQAVLGHIGG